MDMCWGDGGRGGCQHPPTPWQGAHFHPREVSTPTEILVCVHQEAWARMLVVELFAWEKVCSWEVGGAAAA